MQTLIRLVLDLHCFLDMPFYQNLWTFTLLDSYMSIFTNIKHSYGPWLLSDFVSAQYLFDGIGPSFAFALMLIRLGLD